MNFRTDLALEAAEHLSPDTPGISSRVENKGDATVTFIEVKDEEHAKQIGKHVGKYVTIEVPPLSDAPFAPDENTEILANEIAKLLPGKGLVLVIGLGNTDITPDALGPQAADMILATRHIPGELKRVTGLDKLRPVAVVAPGVLGQTGIESAELISGLTEKIKPSAVIAIDALASRSLSRLGCTVQLSDAGISPGSGVGNTRPKISQETLNVPVISIGVPTVVDAATLAADLLSPSEEDYASVRDYVAPRGAEMMVTPREIDLLIHRASRLIAMGINCALHPDYPAETLCELIS